MKRIKLRELSPIIILVLILSIFLIGLARAAIISNGNIGGLFNYYLNNPGIDYTSSITGISTSSGYRLDAKNIFPVNFGLNTLRTKSVILGGMGKFIGDIYSGNGILNGDLKASNLYLSNKAISSSTITSDSDLTLTTKDYVISEVIKMFNNCTSTGLLSSLGRNSSICNLLTTNISCPTGKYLESFDILTGNKTCSSKSILVNGCEPKVSYLSNATYTIGTPTIINQPWQDTNSSNPCYYKCKGGYTGISCNIPPPSCATQPNYINATYTVGIPITTNQLWQNKVSTAACYYSCTGGYTGTSCSIAPPSCAIQPNYINATYTIGSPTIANQSWQNTNSANGCYYSCTGGYTGTSCSIAPPLNYPLCDTPDILVGSYKISSCNVGTNTAGIGSVSYGGYFQFGRNQPYPTWTTNQAMLFQGDWMSPGGTDAGSANLWGVSESNSLTATYANVSSANKLKMQGPCATGYHVPTTLEWSNIGSLLGVTQVTSTLKLPIGGLRLYDSTLFSVGQVTYYHSSSPRQQEGYSIFIDSTGKFYPNINVNRSVGLFIRCFKNY